MKPVSFDDQNITYTAIEGMPKCGLLPALRTTDNHIISCWKMSLKERFRVIITGTVWLGVAGLVPQPTFIEAERPYFKPNEILRISPKAAHKIIDDRQLSGRFYTKEGKTYIGIDNSDGNAWTEEFKSRRKCLKWLTELAMKDDIS